MRKKCVAEPCLETWRDVREVVAVAQVSAEAAVGLALAMVGFGAHLRDVGMQRLAEEAHLRASGNLEQLRTYLNRLPPGARGE